MKKVCLLFLSIVFTSKALTQIITQDNEKFGMVDRAGNVIFANVYDEIKLLGLDNPTYVLTRNGKKQLFHLNSATLDTIKYDDVKWEYPNYILKSGDLYGYIYENSNGININKPEYSFIDFIGGNRFICAGKDSLFGVIDRKGVQVIPFEVNFPIKYSNEKDYEYGFYCEPESDKIMFLRKHPISGSLQKKVFKKDEYKFRGKLLIGVKEYIRKGVYLDKTSLEKKTVELSRYITKLTVYDNASLDSLTQFSYKDTSLIEFPEYSSAVSKTKRAGKKRQITLYNPTNGVKIFQCNLKRKEKLEYWGKNGSMSVKITKNNTLLEKETHIGTIKDYSYVPFKKPFVMRYSNIMIGGGGVNNNFPWFWSGR